MHRSQNVSMPDDDKEEAVGPEELVRRETKAVRCLRFVLIAVLIVVGGFLSFATYKVGADAERKAYSKGFEGVSARLTESYKASLTKLMWSAYSIGVAVTSNSNLVESAPNFVIPNFEDLVKGAAQTNRAPIILWAPLIDDEAMKQEWENYAEQQIQTVNGANGGCNVCGSESESIGAPDVNLVLPIGTYTCGQTEWAGQNGVISSKNCPLVVPYVQKYCKCRASGSSAALQRQNASSLAPISGTILENGSSKPVDGPGPYLPVWQVSPSTWWSRLAMHDLLSDKSFSGSIKEMNRTRKTIISEAQPGDGGVSYLFSPVFNGTGNSSSIIGSVIFYLQWDAILSEFVPLGSKGTFVILENSCGQKLTFQSTGDVLELVGFGDQHDPAFSEEKKETTFEDYYTAQTWASPHSTGTSSHLNCAYKINVYPSAEYRSNYITNKPRDYAIGVILIFVCTCIVFAIYDCHVARRQRKVMKAALQRDEIVSSLFPDAVRGRLFRRGQSHSSGSSRSWETTLARLNYCKGPNRSAVTSSTDEESILTNPLPKRGTIADYFPCVTVVFADISGFTAWSSEHDPSQVFHLLETVYRTFDRIANRYGVFKIETIGDCYVAVAGLPEFQPDHAVRVVKFAKECIECMHNLIHDLQETLGPSTSALSIRIGIHSGPVIAGVLRGEKSRFQLFGDTMNTTSRVQTTGEINRIQISTTTAKLLEEANKSHWFQTRDELVAMKGKGLVQTFWVNVNDLTEEEDFARGSSSQSEYAPELFMNAMSSSPLQVESCTGDTTESLVATTTLLLMSFLKRIVLSRHRNDNSVEDVIGAKEIDFMAVEQHLHNFVAAIAASYSDNPYHNFEHASNVAQLAAEIIGCMQNWELNHRDGDRVHHNLTIAKLDDLSGDVADESLELSFDIFQMHFAVVLFAIVRDVKYTAIQQHLENVFRTGIDYAWSLLLTDHHHELLRSICGDCRKQQQFRCTLEQATAMIANVLPSSSDISHARSQVSHSTDEGFMDSNTRDKFKCIILATEMAHKMQDWATFKLWNERQWEERVLDHRSGISEHDPAAGWYEAEIRCFDDFVIPLAQKISEFCGGDGDKFLRSAKDNRDKWELEGSEIVRSLIDKYRFLRDTS